jgi:hypothetical protein
MLQFMLRWLVFRRYSFYNMHTASKVYLRMRGGRRAAGYGLC